MDKPGTLVRFSLTDNNRPRNMLSFKTSAFCTIDGSANSTYAYLVGQSAHFSLQHARNEAGVDAHPLGWPVNLSQRIVTRLIVPHAWKCA